MLQRLIGNNHVSRISPQCPPKMGEYTFVKSNYQLLVRFLPIPRFGLFGTFYAVFSWSMGQKSYWPIGGQIFMKTVQFFRWNILYLTITKEFWGKHDFFVVCNPTYLREHFQNPAIAKKREIYYHKTWIQIQESNMKKETATPLQIIWNPNK